VLEVSTISDLMDGVAARWQVFVVEIPISSLGVDAIPVDAISVVDYVASIIHQREDHLIWHLWSVAGTGVCKLLKVVSFDSNDNVLSLAVGILPVVEVIIASAPGGIKFGSVPVLVHRE